MKPVLSPSKDRRIDPQESITVGGVVIETAKPPEGLVHRADLGILLNSGVAAQRIHIDEFICHPRAIRRLDGDYLLMFPAGPMHYGWAKKNSKGNTMLAARSADKGRTWTIQEAGWQTTYSHHAAILFRPQGSQKLYAFGTEPRHDVYDGEENAAIGFRISEDDGETWSDVRLISPLNAPDFRAMSAMRMCETADGSWLLGAHAGIWSGEEGAGRRVKTQQFLLRSEDQGESWTLLPGDWPQGWDVPEYERMDEGRPIHLGENKVLFMVRTPTGYLWELRSDDAGRTWTDPRPTALAHPDAPPMLFHLQNGKTLVAFHHNKNLPGHMSHENRTELWASLSNDGGATWLEPRFIVANTAEPATLGGWGGSTPMVSYADLLVDGDDLHLFIDHQMRQVLHLQFRESDLSRFPTRRDLTELQPGSTSG